MKQKLKHLLELVIDLYGMNKLSIEDLYRIATAVRTIEICI